MATIKDVAKKAGVSVATVSRTFSGTQHVSPEIRERVAIVAESLNYRPNAIAKATIAQQPEKIGRLGVDNAVKVVNGKSIKKNIPVEVKMVTKDNVSQFMSGGSTGG